MNCCHARSKKRGYRVTRGYIFSFSPTLDFITHPVMILQLRQHHRLVKSHTGSESNLLFPGQSLLRSNQNNPVGSLCPVKGRSRGSFQNANTLDIFRIQIRNPISGIPISRISRSPDSRVRLLTTFIQHGYPVNHVQRLIIPSHGSVPSHHDFHSPSHSRRTPVHLHSGHFSHQRHDHVRVFHPD